MTALTDVVIIGAGPSGATAAALLRQRGYAVVMIEKQHFPRFSIGESLLPQCMVFLEEAGMLDSVRASADQFGFQFKNGAAFMRGAERNFYLFTEKFSAGPGTTWQVRRADFDKLLADAAAAQGADIRYGHEVLAVDVDTAQPLLTIGTEQGEQYQLQARFVLDASGFGRILPKMLDLEAPSNFPVRSALFTHVQDNITAADFDREKILITVFAADHRAWFWLIPFADGRSSLGVVAEQVFFEQFKQQHQLPADISHDDLLKAIIKADAALSAVLKDADFVLPVRQLTGYAANVRQLYGNNFALLGNAGEFLDPVFSSGVTIAMKSSSLCVPLLDKYLQGEAVNWQTDYEDELRRGIKVFRAYVEAWYEGSFQDIVFSAHQQKNVKEMICSLLAGYAWDQQNPMNADAKHRLGVITEYCREAGQEQAGA